MTTATTTNATKNKSLTIRTNAEEYDRIKDFARFQGKTVSAFVMDAVWTQIEDREDTQAVEKYLTNRARGEEKTVSHEDFMKELGLR